MKEPTRWSVKLELEFNDLAIDEALDQITKEDLSRLEMLSKVRSKYLTQRIGELAGKKMR